MAIGTGIAKQLRYKVESAWGTAPGTTGGQRLRRVTSNLALTKDSYQSQEKVSHYQVVDMRHGVRRVAGAINGELSPGTYADFIAAVLRKDFAAIAAITGLSITIAASGSDYTITRSAGSWLTDGVKVGHVVRLTAGAFNAANLNKNILVRSLTDTVITGRVLNGTTMTAEGPIATATLSIPGKVAYAPTSGHTDKSYAIEEWHSDVSLSELYLGCKFPNMRISLPPTGMSTIGFDVLGKDVTKASSVYYTSPTAETEFGILAAVNGLMLVQGSAVALLTGLNFGVAGGHASQPVVGSNTLPEIAEGRIVVSGSFTALLENGTLRDYLHDETEVSLVAALSASNAAAADFMGFTLPRVKLTSADKDDPEASITQSFGFQALLNVNGGAGTSSEETTINVQDSQAP